MGGLAAKNPSKAFLVLPGGVMVVIVATAFGIKMPPPIPVKARTAMNDSYVGQKPFNNENSVKIADPINTSR
jgi:hypothetical protein